MLKNYLAVSILFVSGSLAAQSNSAEEVARLHAKIQELEAKVIQLQSKLELAGVTSKSKPSDAGADKKAGEEPTRAKVVLDLRERLYVYRSQRRPKETLKAAAELAKIDSSNPWPHFIMGEGYMSYGESFNKRKALAAFKKFLALAGTAQDYEADRLQAHRYVLRLKDNRPIVLLTPTAEIESRVAAIQRGIDNNQQVKANAQRDISGAESYISRMSGSGHPYARTHIAAKRRVISKRRKIIAKAEKYIRAQQEELGALQSELGSRPKEPTLRLSGAGR